MKKFALSVITGLIVLIISATGCRSTKPEIEKVNSLRVKILSYNVKNCVGMDGVINYQRVADIINRIDPEIVALQELDSATQRSNGVIVLNELASLTNMFPSYSASIDYQGGKYGIGVLTKEKPLGWKVVPLPGREERRSLLIVELDKIIIGCTHFSLNEEDRLASVYIVSNAFKNYSKPVFLAGDLNSVPESMVIKSIGSYWNILTNPSFPTIPSHNPGKCIDYILGIKATNYSFQTRQTIVEQEPVASDHLPVWASIEVRYH
ncbi:MAG: endonuclease/exonuclease/phosphatase family protein [Bacteroidales bacterium]|nr:endonuclease/exonuclease/phosphatase family protein [Bacteroidales bacterium]